MFKQQRDITPPTSDDEEPRRRLVDYSDTESSDDEDNIRPPPRPMVIYSDTESSDDEEDEDLTSYYTIKTVKEKKSRLFRAQGKEFNSTSTLSLTMFHTYSSFTASHSSLPGTASMGTGTFYPEKKISSFQA